MNRYTNVSLTFLNLRSPAIFVFLLQSFDMENKKKQFESSDYSKCWNVSLTKVQASMIDP